MLFITTSFSVTRFLLSLPTEKGINGGCLVTDECLPVDSICHGTLKTCQCPAGKFLLGSACLDRKSKNKMLFLPC